ncbi:MAG: recombinase family protein [Candidatus Heimdallarchaeaceae archaeon]
MKAAIYARVSKEEEGMQDPENQLVPLRKLASTLNCEIYKEYVDRASGGNSNRPQFQAMLRDAKQHKFDIVLIWALDRFSRESLHNTLKYIQILKDNNIALKSLQESWLDTRDSGISELLLAIFAWVAKQERERISQRTKAALQRRKNLGLNLGRPKKYDHKEILAMYNAGLTKSEIAKELNITVSTVRYVLKKLKKTSPHDSAPVT